MTTTTGPVTPFDPEAAAALAALGGFPPITPDLIPVVRQGLPGQLPRATRNSPATAPSPSRNAASPDPTVPPTSAC